MKLRYVEARHAHSPCVLSDDDVKGVGSRSINLLHAQRNWRDEASPSWQLGEWGSNKEKRVRFNKWLPDFSASASCDVRTVSDPADAYGQDDALCFKFNAEAVSAMARTIAHIAPHEVPLEVRKWELRAIYIRWLANCQLVDILSVFDIPNTDSAAADFEAFNAALTKPIDVLWPVFISVIDYAWRTFCHVETQVGQKVGSWDNLNWPFGQPRAFYEQEHPDFDPSNEYQYDAILIVESGKWKLKKILRNLKLKLEPGATFPNGQRVFISERAVTVLYLPSGCRRRREQNSPFGKDAHLVLGIVFVSLILKYDSYNQRLYAAILNELVAPRLFVDGQTLRRLVYRTEQLRIILHARSLLLSEHLNQIYDAWSDTCGLLELSRRVDRLADLVISAAEGIESKEQQAFEYRVQATGLIFLVFTFVTFVIDMWNFTHADQSANIGDYLRSYRVTVFLIATVLAALVFLGATVLIKRRRNRAGRGKRGGKLRSVSLAQP